MVPRRVFVVPRISIKYIQMKTFVGIVPYCHIISTTHSYSTYQLSPRLSFQKGVSWKSMTIYIHMYNQFQCHTWFQEGCLLFPGSNLLDGACSGEVWGLVPFLTIGADPSSIWRLWDTYWRLIASPKNILATCLANISHSVPKYSRSFNPWVPLWTGDNIYCGTLFEKLYWFVLNLITGDCNLYWVNLCLFET